MTVIELMGECIQRLEGVRLPVAEVVNAMTIAGVADDMRKCIDALNTYAEQHPQEANQEESEDPAEAAGDEEKESHEEGWDEE